MAFARLERAAWTDPAVAAAYEELFRPMVEGAVEPLLSLAEVGEGHRVLEVACGPGRVSVAARGRGARTTLLDFSTPMLARARIHNPDAPRVTASADRLPLRAGTMDRVVCNFGLLHLADPDAALREAARVLVPEGRGAWSVWAQDAEAMQLIPRSLTELGLRPSLPEGPPFFRFADPLEFERALSGAGLIPFTARTVRWTVVLDSPEVFLRMFEEGSARTRAALQALGESDRARLHRRLLHRLEEYRVDGHLEVPTAAVVGSARRPR